MKKEVEFIPGTVVIVDDHAMMRNGLKNWLELNTSWKITGLADSVQQGIELINQTLPEICIIDVQLNEEEGFKLLEYITTELCGIKCVMYSMFDTVGYVLQAKLLGAKGYVSKASSEEELATCLEIVHKGGSFLEEKMQSSQQKIEEILSYMTKQEKRVFQEILLKKTNEQIAEDLNMSHHSVECYVSRIYDVTGIRNRAQLIENFQ